ncbi:hypothetical protein [Sandarakinorhabdus sp. DWP1-3-1]|uniref:hypothetical protein n=1 Tax=Sandarakinorhabdus sp. DWP1-3-1 TaxID=2804627 RepID=UPI003CFA1046
MALLAGPVNARTVDYSHLNAANFAAEAANLKIAPTTPPPADSGRDIKTEIAAGVDHEVLTLGNYCSAYKVENPMAAMLKALFAEAARKPTSVAALPPLSIRVTAARSNQRCVEVKEYNVRCIARVTIVGEGEVESRKFPLNIVVERDSSVGGFCEDRARGVGIVSREAGQQFLAAALVAANAPAAPVP